MKPIRLLAVAPFLYCRALWRRCLALSSTQQIDALYPQMRALYEDLHRSPELSLHEEKTAAKIADQLRKLGYEVTTGVGGTAWSAS